MTTDMPPSAHPPPDARAAGPGPDKLHWPLILLLGAVALIRPLLHLTGVIGGLVPSGPVAVLVVTVAITAGWVAAVLIGGVTRPVLTLVLAALAYAVMAMILSSILSPILLGERQGPLANPMALPSMLATNALWGLIAGGIAAGLRRVVARR